MTSLEGSGRYPPEQRAPTSEAVLDYPMVTVGGSVAPVVLAQN
jgi:hypothetical protein